MGALGGVTISVSAIFSPSISLVLVLAAFLLLLALPAREADAAGYLVDTTSDSALLTTCNAGAPGDCSLRGAIANANASGVGDVITFGNVSSIIITSSLPTLTGGGDTIDATGNGVVIDAVNIEPATAAFNCLNIGSPNNTVKGLQVTDCQIGINVGHSSNTVRRNTLYDNLVGISAFANSNTIAGNMVGTWVTGMAVHPDGGNQTGISVIGDSNVIGGILTEDRNIISANTGAGFDIQPSADATLVIGNYIGTDALGAADLGNTTSGAFVFGTNSVIGGDTTAERNVISGNNSNGIVVSNGATTGNSILGNYIGTDATGAVDLGNGASGVRVQNGTGNCIGGAIVSTVCTSSAATRNVISGNDFAGFDITQAGSTGNTVLANYIGLQADGASPLGNTSHGVSIDGGASNNEIGSPTPATETNRIAHNGGDGVFVFSGTGNRVLRNKIYSNTGLGIDLGTNGITPNDIGDADTGANNLQNFPVITSINASGGTTHLDWTLDSTQFANFDFAFFQNVACDPTTFGEGQTFLGSSTQTQGGGPTSYSATLPGQAADGHFITATAKPAVSGDTSEFSACIPVVNDADDDNDGVTDTAETAQLTSPWNPDTDEDSVIDGVDNCPLWPNAEQTLPSWPVPAQDVDCDGWNAAREAHVATDPTKHCNDNTGVNNEPDAWPGDFNDNQLTNLADIVTFGPTFNKLQGQAGYNQRYDLNVTNQVLLSDVVIMGPFFNKLCG